MTLDVLVIGRVATLAGERGLGWVEAVGISGGPVAVAGRLTDVEPLAGASTRRLVLADGEVALPAMTDAHIHLVEAAIDEPTRPGGALSTVRPRLVLDEGVVAFEV